MVFKKPVTNNDVLEGSLNKTWFSHPNFNQQQVYFHYTDACHILTCLRSKICTTGISGLNSDAWKKAAESNETKLNVAIVIECIDKQSVAFAKRVFAEDVELFMTKHSYDKEARFVRFIRRWFEAEDDAGISACERCKRRVELRDYLLENVNFGQFPPKTQYVTGIPIVTFESLLVHIEWKLQIYQFLPSRSYNARALGTQEVEQFFSTIKDLDPSGLGTPKPDDIPEMIATAAYLDNIRMDPDRTFYIKTSKAPVYPDNSLSRSPDAMDMQSDTMGLVTPLTDQNYKCRDHAFDTAARKRIQPKRKSGIVSVPDKTAHGQRGVRQYHACDESKVLAHYRKGLSDLE